MSNRLRVTGIPTPPADDAWRPGIGYVRFEPAGEAAENWSVPGYRPGWPITGVPNGSGTGLQEVNGGSLFVPGDEPGDAYAGPWMRVTYELQTTAGTWHRGSYRWRAVSTGGGSIDLRTPAPELEPPTVSRPGVPAQALTTADLGVRVVEPSAVAVLDEAPLPSVEFAAGNDGFGFRVLSQVGSQVRTSTHVQLAFFVEIYAAPGYTNNGFSFTQFRVKPPAGWQLLHIVSATSSTWAADGNPRPVMIAERDLVSVLTLDGQRAHVVVAMRRA